ncbi:MAG: polysaccharide biosynthesis tyrosine autokinase [Cyclobacteriaceae bacterium]|nr:polysaccharide biosynthesis tyrosine autokinase [Cyclobacteriaceae bacterium]
MENKTLKDEIIRYSETDEYQSVDFEKLLSILNKSSVWLILIFIVSISVAYLTIRWTKPLYKSESELKLDFKSEATALGISNVMENQNINHISGEIELLSSKLFFKKVIDASDITVSYNSRGNILNDERYKHTPFIVEYSLMDGQLLDKEIDINFISDSEYKMRYYIGEKEYKKTYKFGDIVNVDGSEITLNKTIYFDSESDENYFFVIQSLDALYQYFENNLEIHPLNFQANTIKINLKDHNRYKARELVDIINSVYLIYSQEQKTIENNSKINWLNNELVNVEKKLEEYEDYFEKFTINNRTNNLDLLLNETIEAIQELDSQRFNIQHHLASLNNLKQKIDNKDKVYEVVSFTDQLSRTFLEDINKYNELVLDYERISQVYSESTYAYKKKLSEIESTKSLLVANVHEKINYLEDEIKIIAARKRMLESSFNEIPSKDRKFKKAQLYYSLYEEHYLAIMQARTDFEVARAGMKNNIIVLSSATLPTHPISPDSVIIYGIGIVFGLVFCIFFIGVRYLLSNGITSLNELERLTNGMAILGAIPKYSKVKLNETRLIVTKSSRSSISEALRSIRTNMEFLGGGKKNKIVSVTSTVSTEGKTFVSVNLGGILSLSDRKVIIVDIDMRKPTVHKAFTNQNNEKGVSTILIRRHTLEESICKSEIDTLHYLPAGPIPPNPSELLLNGEFDKLIDELAKKYDHIILDTPPSSIVTDAVLVMKKADIPIYVFRADFSKKQFVKNLNRLKVVNKFNNIALILNGLQSINNKYGYGYYLDENK